MSRAAPVGRILALAAFAMLHAPTARPETLYVAPGGDDGWSGRIPAPDPSKKDGPLASLTGARNAIRRLKGAGPLRGPTEVIVRAGTYRIAEPFVLEPEDSGTKEAPITYRGEGPERPVVSGGRVVRGWRREGRLWVAAVPEARGGPGFSALWVNGERRTKAREPDDVYFFTRGKAAPAKDAATGKDVPRERLAFSYDGDEIRPWRDLDGVAVVAYHSWETSLHRIASIEADSRTVVFTGPAPWPFENWGPRQRYRVEGSREFLDSPGEWHFDAKSGLLSYLPLEGEDFERAETVVPVAKQLVLLSGDPAAGKFIEHVNFADLRLLHTDWTLPPEGHADSQAAASIPGALQAIGARRCALRRVEIGAVATYGVWLRAGSKEIRIEECEIHDLGAGGVRIGETRDARKEDETVERNSVHNSFIHDGSKIFSGAVGLWIGRSSHNAVTRSEICDFDYTGVSIGWSWGYSPSSAHHNLIEGNRIHHLGRGVMNDLGAIYTLGISPGTVERLNLMHDCYSYVFGGWGVYTDEGSTGILIEQNIVYNTSSGCFHQHYGKENVLRNNVFAFGKEGVLRRSREEDHASFTFERNVVLSKGTPFHISEWSNGRYEIDRNLYWDYASKEPRFFGMPFADWQAKGRDRRSSVADPLCEEPERFDFRLKAGSPALSIGFEPIDTTRIGLTGDPDWVQKPRKLVRKK